MAEETKKQTTSKKTSGAAKKTATAKKESVKKTAAKAETVAKKKTAAKTTAVSKKDSGAKKVVADEKKTATKKVAAKESVKKDAAKKEVKAAKKIEKSEKEVKTKPVSKEKINKNKTLFVKHKEVVKKWFILDAAGKPLGRVATQAALMLRGKHKVDFTPNVDCGDNIIIINCKDTVLTGKKLQQKVRYHHSGWMGGIKETKYSELMEKNPEKAMTLAVEGMLPHNSLGAKMAKHLRTYRDDKHGQEAQKPEIFEFKV